MKFLVSLAVCIFVITEVNTQYPPSSQYGPPGGGRRGGFGNRQGNFGGGYSDFSDGTNYNFMYEVQDGAAGLDFGHQESKTGDSAVGSYHVLLPDGRHQRVEYTANQDGYQPVVSYNGGGFGGSRPGFGSGYNPPRTGGYRYRR